MVDHAAAMCHIMEYGTLCFGPVCIGKEAVVRPEAMLWRLHGLPEGATLGPRSAIHRGLRMHAGEHYQGSPAVAMQVLPAKQAAHMAV